MGRCCQPMGLFLTVAVLRETGNVRERNACLLVGMSLIIPNLPPVFFQDTLKAVGVGWGRQSYQGRETTGSQ